MLNLGVVRSLIRVSAKLRKMFAGMPMPKAIFLRFLSGVSLVLLTFTLVLWIRSYWSVDNLQFVWSRRLSFVSVTGRIEVDAAYSLAGEYGGVYKLLPVSPSPSLKYDCWKAPSSTVASGGRQRHRSLLLPKTEHFQTWFESMPMPDGQPGRWINESWRWSLMAPSWYFMVAFSLLPSVRIVRAIRRRSIRSAGICSACGYNMRATRNRCPECGATSTKSL